jgi:hypothetical protein
MFTWYVVHELQLDECNRRPAGQRMIRTAAASSMPDTHVLQGPTMKNVHGRFLLSVSLVALSLQLLIYTESAVCEAVSAEGSNPNSSVLLGACSFVYRTVL